jgi:hypothetical protein
MSASPSRHPDPFWTGMSLGVLLVFTAANVFMLLFIVPKFGQIFADAMPGKPLPPVTELILSGRLIIMALNGALVILCAYLVQRGNRQSILLINLATIWNFIQIGATVIALFMPMVGELTGTSVACG